MDFSKESEDADLNDPDDVSSWEASSVSGSDSTGRYEDILPPKTALRTAESGCPVCGNLDNRNWGWIADVLVTTLEILTKSSMNCSTCGIILEGISAHLDLEPDSRLEFCCSQGGSFFALHPLQVGTVDYEASDREEYRFSNQSTSSDEADNGNPDGDETVDEKESETIYSLDVQSQDGHSKKYIWHYESEGSFGLSEKSIDLYDSGPSETIEFYVEPGNTTNPLHSQHDRFEMSSDAF